MLYKGTPVSSRIPQLREDCRHVGAAVLRASGGAWPPVFHSACLLNAVTALAYARWVSTSPEVAPETEIEASAVDPDSIQAIQDAQRAREALPGKALALAVQLWIPI